MQLETIIGLEVHVQLDTASKIFSSASASFNPMPNQQACEVDLALPGTLPVLNQEAVQMALRFGLAIGAKIAKTTVFHRKNYFYPDLPKGYQISQLNEPIVGNGQLKLNTDNSRTLNIERAHLEEDAGKLLHNYNGEMTGVDLNRAGVPLLEIVTMPDIRSAEEAGEWMRSIHHLVCYLGICNGAMEEGSLRCDANVSLRPKGQEAFGVRVEIKNLNSFRFVEQALNFEIKRQGDLLQTNAEVVRETRLYDSDLRQTRPMRSKEYAEDYRYFPEPDLLPLIIEDSLLEQIRQSLPELLEARMGRYQTEYDLPEKTIQYLCQNAKIADYFDAITTASGNAKASANWMLGEVAATAKQLKVDSTQIPVSASKLGELIRRVDQGDISTKAAKVIFQTLCQKPTLQVDEAIASSGLQQLSDSNQLSLVVADILQANPKQVAQYQAGKTKVLGFLVGQVMQKTGGQANPQIVSQLLKEQLAIS